MSQVNNKICKNANQTINIKWTENILSGVFVLQYIICNCPKTDRKTNVPKIKSSVCQFKKLKKF